MNGERQFELWALYDHPRDFPDSFVARMFTQDGPTEHVILRDDLDELRGFMVVMGLARMERAEQDDPVIIETWL